MNASRLLMAAGVAVIASTSAFAVPKAKVNLSSWDTDRDMTVSQDEWKETLHQYSFFDVIDTNDNDLFDADEAMDSVAYDKAMDRNGDGRVDQEEFELGLFMRHDANADGKLEDIEWADFAVNSDGSPLFN